MQYRCIITDVVDDEFITVKINEEYLTGFCHPVALEELKEQMIVDIKLFDVTNITPMEEHVIKIAKEGNSLAYRLYGILNVDKCVLRSVIDFELDKSDVFDYGYLDGKPVRVDVTRIDMEFEEMY